MEIERELGF